jgi:hypothetical protein
MGRTGPHVTGINLKKMAELQPNKKRSYTGYLKVIFYIHDHRKI